MASERKEIRVPKEVRELVPDWVEETILGDPQGSHKQYRYGNLHIREYDSEYTVHTDKVDPRKDKLGHLIYDAPEILVGIGCGLFAGYVASKMAQKQDCSYFAKTAIAISTGCASYILTKKIRQRLSEYDDTKRNHKGRK